MVAWPYRTPESGDLTVAWDSPASRSPISCMAGQDHTGHETGQDYRDGFYDGFVPPASRSPISSSKGDQQNTCASDDIYISRVVLESTMFTS